MGCGFMGRKCVVGKIGCVLDVDFTTENPLDRSVYGQPLVNSGTDWVFNKRYFGADGDLINCGGEPSLDIHGESISIEGWVNPEIINDAARVLLHKPGAYYFQIGRSERIEAYLYGTSVPGYHRMSLYMTLGEWSHVALTYDGSELLLFLNGVCESFTTLGPLRSKTQDVILGSENGASRQFVGYVGGMRLYDRTLSPLDIVCIRNREKGLYGVL